jgi:glycosyltransferase involved in cell wall biosynthesis
MRLLIISHVVHYQHDRKIHAYGPYAREVDIWAELFSEVLIAAPFHIEAPADDCCAFNRSNISLVPQRETGGTSIAARARQIVSLPAMVWDLVSAMRKADCIHVRCPGNLGLLGAVLAPLFSRRLVAKYAGQWIDYPGEPRTAKFQRWLLSSRWWRGPVTVYGQWPNQPRNVVPFFTSIMTADQMARARQVNRKRSRDGVLEVLYTGRLSASKNVHILLSAIAELRDEGIPINCTIVGDGSYRPALEAQTVQLGLANRVVFTGSVTFERVLDYYEKADVLVLASETEGWAKSIAEGMAFGLVCIGSDRGLTPWLLGDGRGLIVPPRDVPALKSALKGIAVDQAAYQIMRERAAAWAQQYSLEGLRDSLRALLAERWRMTECRDPAGSF